VAQLFLAALRSVGGRPAFVTSACTDRYERQPDPTASFLQAPRAPRVAPVRSRIIRGSCLWGGPSPGLSAPSSSSFRPLQQVHGSCVIATSRMSSQVDTSTGVDRTPKTVAIIGAGVTGLLVGQGLKKAGLSRKAKKVNYPLEAGTNVFVEWVSSGCLRSRPVARISRCVFSSTAQYFFFFFFFFFGLLISRINESISSLFL